MAKVPTPIVSPGCLPPHKACELEWYYCPRDPGCVTYDMSAVRVELDVQVTNISFIRSRLHPP